MSIDVSNALKKYRIPVFGEQYIVLTDESEEHLQATAQLVDLHMREIASKTQLTDSKRIAVLAALQIASKALASQQVVEKHQQYSDKLIELLNHEVSST